MPAIDSGKVLVTGANGYIAVWIVKTFLERGFAVRGTVRSDAKGAQLRDIFKTYGDQFEYVIVEDMAKVNAYLRLSPGISLNVCVGRRIRWSSDRRRRHRAHSLAILDERY